MRTWIAGSVVLVIGTSFAPSGGWVHERIPLGESPQRVRIARLDDDAWPDLVTMTGVFDSHEPNTLRVLLADGRGGHSPHWDAALTSFIGNHGIPLDAGDLDGDGHTDLVLANENGDGGTFLRFGDGSGTFEAEVKGPEYRGWMEDIELIDYDEDGDLDIIAATCENQSYYADRFRSLGDGSFEQGGFRFVGFFHEWDYSFVSGGNITTNEEHDWVLSSPHVLGVFVYPAPGHQIAHGPRSHTAVGDFDGNGFDDVASTLAGADMLEVYLSSGTLPLTLHESLTAGRRPTALTATDLDLDGDLDLVVCNTDSDTLSLFHNRGDGSFRRGAVLPTGPGPAHVEAGDLDLDGDPDLVVANRAGESLSVLRNPLR